MAESLVAVAVLGAGPAALRFTTAEAVVVIAEVDGCCWPTTVTAAEGVVVVNDDDTTLLVLSPLWLSDEVDVLITPGKVCGLPSSSGPWQSSAGRAAPAAGPP